MNRRTLSQCSPLRRACKAWSADRGRYLFSLVAHGLVIPSRNLFLSHPCSGIACFLYIVAKRLVPLARAERDLRFDRPWTRLGRVLQVLAGAVEASALPGRRHDSHPDFCRLHSPGGSRLLAADRWHLRELRDARPVRRTGANLRHHYGLRRHRRLHLHGGRRSPSDSSSSPRDMPCPRSTAKATRPTPSSFWG